MDRLTLIHALSNGELLQCDDRYTNQPGSIFEINEYHFQKERVYFVVLGHDRRICFGGAKKIMGILS